MPRSEPSRLSYLPQLDGFRGLGMLLVIFAHLPRPSDSPLISALWRAEHAVKLADIALDAFFVMSGFLITRLLLAERQRAGRIDLRAFYLRRVLRIFPIYYLTILAVTLIWPTDPARAASLFLYTYNLYLPFHPASYPMEQSWSLAVEEQFYVLWPLLLILLPSRWLGRTTLFVLPVVALLSAVLLAATVSPEEAGRLIYMSLPTRMLPLALGCGLAVLEQRGRTVSLRTALATTILGSALLLAAVAGRSAGLVSAGGWYWTLILPGVTLVSTSLIVTLINPAAPRALVAPFSTRVARYLGRISYAAYLFHLPILFAFGINEAALGGGPAPWRVSALAVLLALALAALSWYSVERPLSRLKSRFNRQQLAT